jgi:AcrR family transcriptional regulator
MKQVLGSVGGTDVLTPSLPLDIGDRSQQKRIVEAMAKSCAEKTFSATTIADIVGYASISRATFYKHFTNKRECFDATTELFLAELTSAAEDARAQLEEKSAAAIRNALKAVLELLAAKPDHAQLLLLEAPNVDPEIVRRYRAQILLALQAQYQAGKGPRQASANPDLAFGRAKVLITDYVAAGKAAQLPALLPELVYIALLPYLGQDLALAEARLSR